MQQKNKPIVQANCFSLLPELFAEMNSSLPEESRSLGGYFCLTGVWQPETPILIMQVGEQPEASRIRSFGFCQEKAQRLLAHPDHVSSWQSRNEAAQSYGGAIRCGDYAFSFSGLPELADEAMMLTLLRHNKWCTWQIERKPAEYDLDAIARLSQNPYYLAK